MIYWAQLLHFYQPPTQRHSIVEKVCVESYGPLLEVLRQNPHARITVNISGSLTEMLRDHGKGEILQGFKELGERGQIEFTGSGKYHPILPLIPKKEVERQILLNKITNNHSLGSVFNPIGFFPPEMCYSRDILEPVIETGHKWIILSGVACTGKWPTKVIHHIEEKIGRISVFFRDDILSNKISFRSLNSQEFLDHLKGFYGGKEKSYVITAMDGETFGHHIRGWEKLFLAEVYKALEPTKENTGVRGQGSGVRGQESGGKDLLTPHPSPLTPSSQIQMVTISELLDIFTEGGVIDPRPSSWSTMGEDISAGNPYPLWKGKDNQLHQWQWEHMNLCLDTVKAAIEIADNGKSRQFARIARGFLDEALHSCQFWWATKRPMWDINMIHKGIVQQWEVIVNAFKAINISGIPAEKKREYYYRVIVSKDIRDKIMDKLLLDEG